MASLSQGMRSSRKREIFQGDPLQLLVQGMRQLQQVHMAKKDNAEHEAPKNGIELPQMPDLTGDSAVEFNDWLYMAEQVVGSLTDNASTWFSLNLVCAREAYGRYQTSTPMARLSVSPIRPPELRDVKWSRLERRVSTMLLSAMPKVAKEDAVTHRLSDVASMLYRLHVLFQPGGNAERAAILRHLDGQQGTESTAETVAQLRRWRRYHARAQEMGLSLPDPSLQLKGIDLITAKVLEKNGDVNFRLALARNDLQLQARPTQDSVLKYYDHALAELQQATPAKSARSASALSLDAPKLKAIGQGNGESSPPSSTSPTRGKTPCKFFASDQGCRRGSSCPYEHSYLSKEDKKTRCWTCGSKQHRQGECPTKDAGKLKNGRGAATPKAAALVAPASASTGTASELSTSLMVSTQPAASATSQPTSNSPAPQAASTSETTGMLQPTEAQKEKEVKALLQEANAMLSKIARLSSIKATTDESVEKLDGLMRSVGLVDLSGTALLDSGASHPYRKGDEVETQASRTVKVQLADGKEVLLRQNKAGTLMPVACSEDSHVAPIVPLGDLVQTLGCEVTWTRREGLVVKHPVHGTMSTHVSGRCPIIGESLALELIAEIETQKLRELEQKTVDSHLRAYGWTDDHYGSWRKGMSRFVRTGKRSHGLEALMARESPMGPLTETTRSLLVEELDLTEKAGWMYLKALPLKRATRKALLRSQWCLHLYAGEKNGRSEELKVLEKEGVVYLEVDVHQSKAYNMRGYSPVYKALLWAAATGRLEGVLGAPPRSEAEGELTTKQMFLWMVAEQASREQHTNVPYFALEMPLRSSLWSSSMWSSFQEEYNVPVLEMFLEVKEEAYHVASNLDLYDYGSPILDVATCSGSPMAPSTWPAWMYRALANGVLAWRKNPDEVYMARLLSKMDGPLEGMTDKDLRRWAQHVRDGHLPFHKRCRTCVETAATGRAHRRVLAPSCYALSLDILGPLRVKGETADEKKYRYVLVGSYTMPKLEVFKDVEIPADCDGEDGTPEAEEEDKVFVELFDSEGVEEEPIPLTQDEENQDAEDNAKFARVFKEVGDSMEYQVLHFAVPLVTRRTMEVFAAVRRLYLQLRAEGLPLVRLHSDRAREFRTQPLREWLSARDVLQTTGEAQAPQSNGRAEGLVKRLKTRSKTLLKASGLPRTCWPLAMVYAAWQQREYALGRGRHVLPFGTAVHIRTKVFGTGGKYDLEDRWSAGHFVGPSQDVKDGMVARLPTGGYVTSVRVRPNLIDVDSLYQPESFEMDLPAPTTRKKGKTTLATLEQLESEAQRRRRLEAEAEGLAKVFLEKESYDTKDVMRLYSILEGLGQLNTRMTTSAATTSWYAGMFVQGGMAGIRVGSRRTPWTTKYLVKFAKRRTGVEQFTALGITRNAAIAIHRDSHNHQATQNHVYPLTEFEGGGIWVENESLTDGAGVWKEVAPMKWRRGLVHPLEKERLFSFSPRRWHEVQPWEGNRVVMILYTPRYGTLYAGDQEYLETQGFNFVKKEAELEVIPKEEAFDILRAGALDPEVLQSSKLAFGSEQESDSDGAPVLYLVRSSEGDCERAVGEGLQRIWEGQEQLIEDLEEQGERLRTLLEEEAVLLEECQRAGRDVLDEVQEQQRVIEKMLEEIAKDIQSHAKLEMKKCLMALDAEEEPDYEQLLANLESDLRVVYTIPLGQVKPVLRRWVPAISKEIDNLFDGTLSRISISEAKRLEAEGLVKILPSKGVFTVKPPTDSAHKFKRKFRLVICGNYAPRPGAEDEAMSLYAGGASAETFRAALAYAAARGWSGATSDVTGAFLLADWPENLPKYAVHPPKILLETKHALPGEAWLVHRPLYGTREAPAVWARFRSKRMSGAQVPLRNGYVTLKASVVDPELWYAYDDEGILGPRGRLVGFIITYVDDLFYLSAPEVVEAMHAWIKKEWPCSVLEWAHAPEGTRYLGMMIKQDPDGSFEVSQEGYVLDLLRAHGMEQSAGTKLPCPKEWVLDDDQEDAPPENFSEEELKHAQRVVGEQLWLAMRTRPDILYVVNYMASQVSKRPVKVAKVGRRVLAYLQSTSALTLRVPAAGSKGSNNATTDNETTGSASSISQNRHDDSALFNDDVVVRLIGYSDASYAPTGGRSFGASVVTVNDFPVSWKAGRQSFVTLSVMEAELYEASQASVLLEHIGVLMDEITGRSIPRILKVDNSSAVAMLSGGPGSWRTRHLKVKHSHLREQVAQGLLTVEHVDGLFQLADLATKLHPKGRLVELLHLWGFQGLSTQAEGTAQLKAVYAICLIVLLSMLPVATAEEGHSEYTRRVQVAGLDELTFVTLVVCIAAIGLWEFAKFVTRWALGSSGAEKRRKKLQRLRELAAASTQTELSRLAGDSSSETQGSHSEEAEARGSADPSSSGTRGDALALRSPPVTQARAHDEAEAATRPRAPPTTTVIPNPDTGDVERPRVCRDVLQLFITEELKNALRFEGLPVSGVKQDLVARLCPALVVDRGQDGRDRPTTRQLKYVLWLWRTQKLSGRVHLRWDVVGDKTACSCFIEQWKP